MGKTTFCILWNYFLIHCTLFFEKGFKTKGNKIRSNPRLKSHNPVRTNCLAVGRLVGNDVTLTASQTHRFQLDGWPKPVVTTARSPLSTQYSAILHIQDTQLYVHAGTLHAKSISGNN